VPRSLATTHDALFGGRVRLTQPAPGHGYRTNVDALLLAAFAGQGRRPAELAVDLGAGVGAVALCLGHFGYARRLVLIERQPSLVRLARQNLSANGLDERAVAYEWDLARPLAAIVPELVHAASLVVANPPYTSEARDARAPKGEAGKARAPSRRGDLRPFLRAAAEALGHRSRACFIYPAHALVEFFAMAREVKLEPKRLRWVHGREGRPARVALIELCFGKKGGLVVAPPLVETDARGQRAPELCDLLASRAAE
jgi:tRNA1Val (adenine37-N6)-methyltransferase